MPELDLGNVMGPQGLQGPKGETGENGQKGERGEAGKEASINGVNALQIETGQGLESSQSGSTFKISANAAVFNAQAMVNAASAPLTHITLEASELAAWLNALPRLVTKNYVLHVKAGTVAQTLNLSNFYGPGRIRILADDSSGTVTLSGGVSAYFTKIQIALEGFTITGTAESEATVFGYATDCLCLYNCTLVGNGVKYGIYNQACAQIWLNGGSISGYQVAVDAIGLARIGLESVACSDNTRGATVWGCGEVMLSGSTPNTLGGSANSKSGGIITAANGTLL